MTNGKTVKKISGAFSGEGMSILLLGCAVIFALVLSGECAEYVIDGMKLAVLRVIPSSFPFMIISDFYAVYGKPENIRLLGNAFSRLLGISKNGLGAFVAGNVGGFPIGAKMCADAYSCKAISKEDAERLMPLCNNPSLAFTVGGVGIGMWGDIRVGLILFSSVLSATVICGILTRCKTAKNVIFNENKKQNYNFVNSVKAAGFNSLSIISFVCLFSLVSGIIKKRIKNALVLYPIFSVLEVTNAGSMMAAATDFPPIFLIALTSFALGFGGVSVGMQSAVFALSSGLKMRKYYLIKLLEGILSASISSLLLII